MSRSLPGKSIPYELDSQGQTEFFQRNQTNVELQNYIRTHEPAYGIVVNEAYGQILVWYDAGAGALHVVDVTNMAIAAAIRQAPYTSPAPDQIGEILGELSAVVKAAGAGVQTGVSLVVAVGGLWLLAKLLKK